MCSYAHKCALPNVMLGDMLLPRDQHCCLRLAWCSPAHTASSKQMVPVPE